MIRSVANLVRALYEATLVRWMNESRRRRGLPPMDRYGRRCLLAVTLSCLVLGSCTAAIAANPPAPERSSATRSAPLPRTSAPDVNPRPYVPPQPVEPSMTPAEAVDESDTHVEVDIDDDDHVDRPRKSDVCGRLNPFC